MGRFGEWVLSAADMGAGGAGGFAGGDSCCRAAVFDLVDVHIETVCAGREVWVLQR